MSDLIIRDEPGAGPYRKYKTALGQIKDGILAEHYGHAMPRELAMAVSKLDECEHWLIAHGRNIGTHLVIDVQDYRAALQATANPNKTTGTTDETV